MAAGSFLAVLCGCGKDHSPAPGPHGHPGALRVSWMRPAANDLLSDSVRCRVRIEGGAVRRAELSADDSPAVERTVEPWTFCWLPPDSSATGSAGERTIRLRVAAWDTAGTESRSDPLAIRWFPNGVPRVRFIGTESPAWIERVAGESLRVEAIDPDDGVLGGASIDWRSDREGLIGHGECIPVESLIPGRHLLCVRATDRWLRSASAEVVAEVFNYSDRRTPAGLLDDVRHALLDRRTDIYADALGEGFFFIFCPADREIYPDAPVRWNASSEEGFVRRCLSDPDLRFFGVEWTIASLQAARIDGEEGAKAEIAAIEIRLAAGARDTLTVSGGLARVYLRQTRASGIWSIVQWQDLGARTTTTQGRLRLEITRRAGGRGSRTD